MKVKGASLHKIPHYNDIRGNLIVGEYQKQVPFAVKRFFMVHGVPSKEVRGEHAHRATHQFLLCVQGSLHVVLDDGYKREEINLHAMDKGIYVPPLTWTVHYKYTDDAVLLVLASDTYDDKEYIRDYAEFVSIVKKRRRSKKK